MLIFQVIEVEESVAWIPSHDMQPPSFSEMRDWILEGDRKSTVEDETNFCDPDLLQQVLSCKVCKIVLFSKSFIKKIEFQFTFQTIFDRLEPEELRKARSRSNPFETIRGVFFLNRAAMKMANMDAVFDFMFTDPKLENGVIPT